MWDLVAFVGLAVLFVGVVTIIRPIRVLYMKTRGSGAFAMLIGLVLLSVGAVQSQAGKQSEQTGANESLASATTVALAVTQTSVPAPVVAPQRQWTEVASWRGSGIKDTETFTTSNREWRIRWHSENEPFPKAGILQIFVYRPDGEMVNLAANKQGPGDDVSYIRAAPGPFYLKINSGNIDWDITVEEQR